MTDLRVTCAAGALVIPVSLAGSSPFTGLLDLSATSSMLNWWVWLLLPGTIPAYSWKVYSELNWPIMLFMPSATSSAHEC